MYKFYNLTIANDVEQYTLTYELKNHRPAQVWAEIMRERPIECLRPSFNPWQGVNTDVTVLVNTLMGVIQELNEWMPDKITKVWDYNDIQESANQFHTHFPEHKDETDPVRREQLRRYNDLIHAIEVANRINQLKKERLHLLICPDSLNKKILVEYELDDYQYFDGNFSFGDLRIGYNHIGRHPIEIFYAKDTDVPPDQILCEHSIGPIHYVNFNNSRYDRAEFESFYYNSGIQWPYALDDPRLAVGAVIIGKLKYVNGLELTESEIVTVVKSCNKIVAWNVEE